MSDRETLAFALAHIDQHITFGDAPGSLSLRVAVAAARERLAQLPDKCEHGWSVPHTPKPVAGGVSADEWCPGKVYPAETVEKLKAFNFIVTTARAVAVLDALGETE